MQRRLAEVTPTEAEIKAFYARNTAIFGGRSYSESRDAARRLVSIHQVRVGLGVLNPPATARFYAEAETD